VQQPQPASVTGQTALPVQMQVLLLQVLDGHDPGKGKEEKMNKQPNSLLLQFISCTSLM
jgi:hypothetical protein